MSTAMQSRNQNAVAVVGPPRLPYHPAIQERFNVDQTEWRALVESTFPNAKTTGAVILALAYCKARNLDPFKKCVHIVPIWDKERRCEVETVWPGIAEYRTTASRTGIYAGHDEVQHGPTIEHKWQDGEETVTVVFPEWSQMTVYRIVAGNRCPFPGPKVYWLETYASKKNDAPNSMWRDRPIGMIDKCAEAAALRGAFPEELGGELTADEVRGFRWQGRDAIDVPKVPGTKTEMLLEEESLPTPPQQQTQTADPLKDQTTPADHASRLTEDEKIEASQWREILAGFSTIGEVSDAEKTLPNNFSPALTTRIKEYCEVRRAEIRGQRGGKKDGKLFDAAATATEGGQ